MYILLYILGLFAFCYGFISFSFAFLNNPLDKKRLIHTFVFFIMNLTVIFIYMRLGFGIVIHWIAFLFIAVLYTAFILKAKFSSAVFISLNTGIFGFNTNLFMRALVAFVLNIPLTSIDYFEYELDYAPAVLGFFTCFLVFMHFSRDKFAKPLRHILQTPKHFKSLLLTMSILMLYLLLQNLLYISSKNVMSLKFWSLFSCFYTSFGLLWSIKYTVRFSYLYYLDDQNITLRRILHDYKKQEQNLKQASDYDPLTKILNRRAGDAALNNLIKNGSEFYLCIIDLDGLKYVNDNLGHKYGDVYLKNIADLLKNNCRSNKDILFRYGGDEFVLAFVGMASYHVHARMQYIFEQVLALSEKSEFPMKISYGVCYNSDLPLAKRFEKADEAMYKMKSEHKKQNPDIVRN